MNKLSGEQLKLLSKFFWSFYSYDVSESEFQTLNSSFPHCLSSPRHSVSITIEITLR